MGNSNEGGKIGEITPTLDEYGNDITDYKALALEQNGLARRYHSKYQKYKGMAKEKPAEADAKNEPNKNPNEFDYGQKAYIASVLGAKGEDELALVKDYLTNGKKLDDLANNKHFQADLADLRENRATKEATPSGSARSGQSTNDTVEYWLAKGQLPPASNPELRQQVVNARYNQQKNKNVFTDNPVG